MPSPLVDQPNPLPGYSTQLLDEIHELQTSAIGYLRWGVYLFLTVMIFVRTSGFFTANTYHILAVMMEVVLLTLGGVGSFKMKRANAIRREFRRAAGFGLYGFVWYDLSVIAFVASIYSILLTGPVYYAVAAANLLVIEGTYRLGERMYRTYRIQTEASTDTHNI